MNCDAIVIGAGTNGLTTAATLAGRGMKVLVLEQLPVPGGLAASREFHPGYHTAGVLQDTSGVRSRVIDALQLGDHGLQRRSDTPPALAAEESGRGLLLWRDAERTRAELVPRSPADAQRYVDFRAFLGSLSGLGKQVLEAPPPDLGASGVRALRTLFGPALGLRRLGRDRMYDVLRVLPMCLHDWLDEWFEDPVLKGALAAPALQATWTGPWSAGTAALLIMREVVADAEIVGGSPALVRALVAACKAKDVVIRTEARVRRVVVNDGAVAGVELDDGSECRAPVVASSADPRRTLLDLLAPMDLPSDLEPELANWRCRGTTAVLHLALDGTLEVAGRPDEAFERIHVTPGLDALERAFDAVKYQQMSERPVLDVSVPTVADPSLAPPGHHVAAITVHHAPHDLEGGWTEEARSQLLERCIAQLGRIAPAVRDRIVGHQLQTPADLEQELGLSGGHVHHGEHALDQLFWSRPTPSCARYETPIRGLFLSGSGSHPGGGLTCAPGALAAAAIARSR